MEPTALPEPPGFSGLLKSEQIQYLQALWDRIAAHPDDISAPEAHLALAEERLAGYRRDPDQARSARETLRRLAKKR